MGLPKGKDHNAKDALALQQWYVLTKDGMSATFTNTKERSRELEADGTKMTADELNAMIAAPQSEPSTSGPSVAKNPEEIAQEAQEKKDKKEAAAEKAKMPKEMCVKYLRAFPKDVTNAKKAQDETKTAKEVPRAEANRYEKKFRDSVKAISGFRDELEAAHAQEHYDMRKILKAKAHVTALHSHLKEWKAVKDVYESK